MRRPWDRHPPWAHWGFYVVWCVAATFGPMSLSIWVLSQLMDAPESIDMLWVGVGLSTIWIATLAADWLLVRWLHTHKHGWEPWQPKQRRWLRS